MSVKALAGLVVVFTCLPSAWSAEVQVRDEVDWADAYRPDWPQRTTRPSWPSGPTPSAWPSRPGGGFAWPNFPSRPGVSHRPVAAPGVGGRPYPTRPIAPAPTAVARPKPNTAPTQVTGVRRNTPPSAAMKEASGGGLLLTDDESEIPDSVYEDDYTLDEGMEDLSDNDSPTEEVNVDDLDFSEDDAGKPDEEAGSPSASGERPDNSASSTGLGDSSSDPSPWPPELLDSGDTGSTTGDGGSSGENGNSSGEELGNTASDDSSKPPGPGDWVPTEPETPKWPAPSDDDKVTWPPRDPGSADTGQNTWPPRYPETSNDSPRPTWPREFDRDKPRPGDPNRPGVKPGDWSFDGSPTSPIIYSDPETEIEYTVTPPAAGPILHFGEGARPISTSPSDSDEIRPNTAPSNTSSPITDGDSLFPGNRTWEATDGLGSSAFDAADSPSAKPAGDGEQERPTSTNPPWDRNGSPSLSSQPDTPVPATPDRDHHANVTVTPGDGLTSVADDLSGLVVDGGMSGAAQRAGQAAVDGIGDAVEWFFDNLPDRNPLAPPDPAVPPTPVPKPPAPGGPTPEQVAAEEAARQRAQERREQRIEKYSDEWQRQEGEKFRQTHGSRPADPTGAAQWDRERDKAINRYGRSKEPSNDVEIKLESATSEGGIRF